MGDNIVALKARKLFITASKVVPFVMCAIICVSYTEIAFSLTCDNFLLMDGYIIPNVPFSWLMGRYFEYSYPLVIALLVIVYATSTCMWNKFACYYIGLALIEKEYFNSIELEIEYIYMVVFANIIVSALLVYKGIRIYTKR